jgi:hypothetical protein
VHGIRGVARLEKIALCLAKGGRRRSGYQSYSDEEQVKGSEFFHNNLDF